jgi:gluconolactonase
MSVMNPSLHIYDDRLLDLIRPGFEIDTWADDCIFTEGPVWNPKGFYLFSDIPANCIYRLERGKKKTVYLSNSGTDNPSDPDLKPDQAGSNALAYDAQGNLLVCQHGGHGIARYDGKSLRPYIHQYKGRLFNSPNDFIIHSDGRIYFSDPPYGLKDGKLNADKFQPIAGVYCWKDGELELISDRYQYPNGVCLSPDESLLYLCSNKPFEASVSVFDTKTNKLLRELAQETSDGIECDRAGNVFLCNKDGLVILDPSGKRLGLITLPTVPANICWGGPESNDLFIAARQNIFYINNLGI